MDHSPNQHQRSRLRVSVLLRLLIVLTLGFSTDQSSEAGDKLNSPTSLANGPILVVCPSLFLDSLEPWKNYRERQGFQVSVIDTGPNAKQLLERIRNHVPRPQAILLVGDAPTIGNAADANRHVPMHYLSTTVSAKFGSTPTLPTDVPYGDLDSDGRCDIAVGRLPVDSPKELANLIDRIKSYELSKDFTEWRNQIQLVGGVGGFGMLADATIESVTRLMITASVPNSVRTRIAYGSPGHLFYPNKRFTSAITEQFNRGCRFWVYAGHGMVEELDRVPRGSSGVPVLDGRSLAELNCKTTCSPIALLLCCYTGAIDAPVDSFAEKMLRHRGGPIAVIAGSRVTMPYGNATMTLGLTESIFGKTEQKLQPARRLGDAWVYAIRSLTSKAPSEPTQLRTMIDGIATLVSPAGTILEHERAEHSALYSLLGDPLLLAAPSRQCKTCHTVGL